MAFAFAFAVAFAFAFAFTFTFSSCVGLVYGQISSISEDHTQLQKQWLAWEQVQPLLGDGGMTIGALKVSGWVGEWVSG